MELKYVRHSEIGFVLWPRTDDLWHAHIGALLRQQCRGEIVSAGFAKPAGGKAKCWGMSESLGIASRPDDSAANKVTIPVQEVDETDRFVCSFNVENGAFNFVLTEKQ